MIASKYFNIDGKCYVEASDYDKLLYKLKHSNDRIAKLEDKINNLRARCRKSAIDALDNGNYGFLYIVTADELKNDELPTDPMEVAQTLINATYKRKNCMTGIEYDRNIYDINDLEQIAEHLLVYCKYHREE